MEPMFQKRRKEWEGEEAVGVELLLQRKHVEQSLCYIGSNASKSSVTKTGAEPLLKRGQQEQNLCYRGSRRNRTLVRKKEEQNLFF